MIILMGPDEKYSLNLVLKTRVSGVEDETP